MTRKDAVVQDRQEDAPRMSLARPFVGTWRIVDMKVWDRDAIDLLGPANVTFGKDGRGNFLFIAVAGDMDCRFGVRDGKPLVEFSWEGLDENDPASGRGWAILDGDVMTGRIFFHAGDDSAFTAKRAGDAKVNTGKPGRSG